MTSFQALPLQVHAVLRGVPLHDVTVVDLPGGGEGRTLTDVRALLPDGLARAGGRVTRLLFATRSWLGQNLSWDRPAERDDSYVARVPAQLAGRSRVVPGTRTGGFSTLYELENEALLEGRNRTVHAFAATVLRPTAAGYRLYWAVYVQPVSRFTWLYMAMIAPFRRWIVYPSILRALRDSWQKRYPSA